jgi:hypothetical protein
MMMIEKGDADAVGYDDENNVDDDYLNDRD